MLSQSSESQVPVLDFLPFSDQHTGEYAVLAALLLAVAHLLAPTIRNGLIAHSARVVSFGGGLAVAYVFLSLIPEIEEAHEFFGDSIHVIILFSFFAFYALESRFLGAPIETVAGHEDQGRVRSYWLHIFLSWIYTWMIVFALPGEVSEDLGLVVFTSLAIGLHVTFKGYVLHTHHREKFERQGRYILALAPILGWIAHTMIQPSEVVFDIFVAVLAGFLMQSVFRDELPSYDQTRFLWMVAGAGVFLMLTVVTG